MAYRPVVELALLHPATASGALPATAIVPDRDTRARLAGLRMLAKPVGERLVLLADTDAAGAPLVPLRAPVRLGFAVAPLPAATDLAALAAAPLFTDERAGRAGGGGADPQPLRRVPADGAPAIAIRLTPADHAAAVAGKVRRCTATLPAAAARWCFHLLTDLAQPLADWRIVRAGGAAGPAPAFGDRGRTELTAPDPDDPAGTALRAAHPGVRVIRFLSDAPVAASATPVRGLELRAGATRLLAALPNPPPGAPVRVGADLVFACTVRVMTA